MIHQCAVILNKFLAILGFSIVRIDWRPDLPALIRRLKNHGIALDTIYDIGAYKGLWTRDLSKQLGKRSRFFLFEPNTVHNPSLEQTGFPFFNVLLSNNSEVKSFVSAEGSGDSYYPEFPDPKLLTNIKRINSVTLDSLIYNQDNHIPMPDLIKIDTQGSELDIMSGAKNVLNHTSVLILECPIVKYNQGAPNIQEYLDFAFKTNFVPIGIVEIHILRDVLVQIDIAFISKQKFSEKIGDLSDIYFWKSTEEYYKTKS